ncbi:MAG: hypothetical protein GY714_15385 [Desulfobacterales bacterium]|nr:hypothetical protein [Desulfobacterales bacterium]MCP4160140.1 hypothetical protein [Deltaproteobacteria bacterium]
MNENDNKRKGPDIWIKIRRISGVVVWFVMLVALYLLDSAKPENVTFFDRLNNIKRRTTWNTDYNQMIFYVMILGLIISVSGLYINSKRNRRKSDKYPLSLLIMMTISIIGILMHLFFF